MDLLRLNPPLNTNSNQILLVSSLIPLHIVLLFGVFMAWFTGCKLVLKARRTNVKNLDTTLFYNAFLQVDNSVTNLLQAALFAMGSYHIMKVADVTTRKSFITKAY